MAPSTIYTRASGSLGSGSNPSVLRSLVSSNTGRYRVTPKRSLWWWSRHGAMSTFKDRGLEERIQKHQEIMRQKYSRALRRRAMWDRDDHISSWFARGSDGRQGRKQGSCRSIASENSQRVRVGDKHGNISRYQKFWTETQKDFDKLDQNFYSLKAAIDRAIEKDPYGALFGRRLQSPPTENNSSWISWLFNRTEPQPETPTMSSTHSVGKKIEIEVLDEFGSPVKSQPSALSGTTTTKPASSEPQDQVQYTYDPISGRNIPLQSSVETAVPPPAQQSLIESLFSEHGSQPDKPIKQHRVYGHEEQTSKPAKEPKQKSDQRTSSAVKGFESSRTREYQQLRAATLGNSIDTTAEFGGKVEQVLPTEPESVENTRTMPAPDDDAPLFSGTAYESKAEEIVQGKGNAGKTWLEKEGFQSHGTVASSQLNPEGASEKLEPSFNRIASESTQRRKFISRLQPAIDRVQLTKVNEAQPAVPDSFQMQRKDTSRIINEIPETTACQPELDQREDVDLLRASDVRAATKAARTTKQEAAQAKTNMRNQLELSFDKLQANSTQEDVPDVKQLRMEAGKATQSLSNVWKHAEQYPDGTVAKTMKLMGMIKEKFMDYRKPYSPGQADLTKPLEFKNDALDSVSSIHKVRQQKPKSVNEAVSQLTAAELKTKAELTAALRLSSKEAADAKSRDDAQIEGLANNIRQIYEAEHGPIDLSLAHNSQSNVKSPDRASDKPLDSESKGEVSNEFFTEQQEFMSKVDQLGKDVRSIRTKSNQFDNEIDRSEMRYQAIKYEAEHLLGQANNLHQVYDLKAQQKFSHPLQTASVKPGVSVHPVIEHHTKVFEQRLIDIIDGLKRSKRELQSMNSMLHDIKRSKVAGDVSVVNSAALIPSQETAEVESSNQSDPLKATIPSSPYLILVYNKTTGEVDQTPMDRLPWAPTEKVEKANPIKIMGNLNYPAAFVTHFVELEKSGYELSSGGGDMLIFHKVKSPAEQQPKPTVPKVATRSEAKLRNMIAAMEASSQPEISETIAQPKTKTTHSKDAATVLDDIPGEIPQPGPAPPTAPPLSSHIKKVPKTGGPRVRRQEQVFSGTIPIRSQPTETDQTSKDDTSGDTSKESTFFQRTTRTLKRGVVGVAAFGAAAYTIGVVAEGIGAQAQIEDDAATGPRKKVVMPIGQRPGIFSTESSRN